MVKEVKLEDSGKPNLEVLREIRVGGKPQKVGSVISKGDIRPKGEWLNLCNMTPPRLVQTSKKVGPAPDKSTEPATPAAPAAPAAGNGK